jgi:hypothetical protein
MGSEDCSVPSFYSSISVCDCKTHKSTACTASKQGVSHSIKSHHSSLRAISHLHYTLPSLEKSILAAEDKLGSTSVVVTFPAKWRQFNCDITSLLLILILRTGSSKIEWWFSDRCLSKSARYLRLSTVE